MRGQHPVAVVGKQGVPIATAPVVIVCCADIRGYLDGTISGSQDPGDKDVLEERIVSILHQNAESLRTVTQDEIAPRIAANVAIAIEHIVLRALDFGLGTCWIRLVESNKVNKIFGWDDNIYVVAPSNWISCRISGS